MAEFMVKTNAVKSAADTEERLRRELDNIQQTVRGISDSLVIRTAGAAGIKRRLSSLAGRVDGQRGSMEKMKNALERAAGLYEAAERNICGYAEGSSSSAQEKKESSFWGDFKDWIQKAVGAVGAVVGGIFSALTATWGRTIFQGLDKILEILGKGHPTPKPPTAGWGDILKWLPKFPEGFPGWFPKGFPRLFPKGFPGWFPDEFIQGGIQVLTELATFEPRIKPPVKEGPEDKYYFSDNPYYSGIGHPDEIYNCTKYAYGRVYELLGKKPPVISGNANAWFNNSGAGYEQEADKTKPRVGAIMCFGGGANGHVAVVEKIEGDMITYSDSGWSGDGLAGWNFQTRTVSINELNKFLGSNYTFQGYIYPRE